MNEQKICTYCGISKSIDSFGNQAKGKNGKNSRCVSCCSKIRREYNAENRETYNSYMREFKKRPDQQIYIKEYAKEYNSTHKDESREYSRNRKRERTKEDPCYRTQLLLSTVIRQTIRKNGKNKTHPTWSKLPYSPQELVEHIEKLWEPWMNWDNYGRMSKEHKTWNIDHIIPQSKLPYDSLDHPNFLKCWALENLRPLDAYENYNKRNKNMSSTDQESGV